MRGDEIAVEGRTTAVADVLDALVSKRPCKEPLPLETGFAILEAEAGKHFDPEVVRVFLELKSQVAAVELACRDE